MRKSAKKPVKSFGDRIAPYIVAGWVIIYIITATIDGTILGHISAIINMSFGFIVFIFPILVFVISVTCAAFIIEHLMKAITKR